MARFAREQVSAMTIVQESAPDETLLELSIQAKFFGTKRVLDNVHLTVKRGEVVGLLGASGCGKSTLLRMIASLDKDFQGEIILAGQKVKGITREVGFIFQEPRLMPWLTVAENVAFDHNAHQGNEDVDALLREVGLHGTAALLPKQLSGGMAQRVSIARGLYTKPKLLLLDEPFSAVDAFTRMKLQDLLLSVAAQHNNAVLMVTHDIDEAVYMCDRVVVIGGQPGNVRADISVDLPRPRDRKNPVLVELRSKGLDALHDVKAI